MKILKPGKVEMRKFVCPKCECIFVADKTEAKYSLGTDYVVCPFCGNGRELTWKSGEPYEEPMQDKTADNDEIIRILCEHCDANYSEAADVAQILINNGVTFREG